MTAPRGQQEPAGVGHRDRGRAAGCEGPRQPVLYDGAIIPDPDGIITGRHNNKTARTIAFKQGETINAQALTAMLKQIIANNRAGGWDKLKKP